MLLSSSAETKLRRPRSQKFASGLVVLPGSRAERFDLRGIGREQEPRRDRGVRRRAEAFEVFVASARIARENVRRRRVAASCRTAPSCRRAGRVPTTPQSARRPMACAHRRGRSRARRARVDRPLSASSRAADGGALPSRTQRSSASNARCSTKCICGPELIGTSVGMPDASARAMSAASSSTGRDPESRADAHRKYVSQCAAPATSHRRNCSLSRWRAGR